MVARKQNALLRRLAILEDWGSSQSSLTLAQDLTTQALTAPEQLRLFNPMS